MGLWIWGEHKSPSRPTDVRSFDISREGRHQIFILRIFFMLSQKIFQQFINQAKHRSRENQAYRVLEWDTRKRIPKHTHVELGGTGTT